MCIKKFVYKRFSKLLLDNRPLIENLRGPHKILPIFLWRRQATFVRTYDSQLGDHLDFVIIIQVFYFTFVIYDWEKLKNDAI